MEVGYDTRSGVDDNDCKPPFRFTGTIGKTPEQMKAAAQMGARGRD